MSFQVGVVAHFSAGHHLVGDFGPASQPHAHAYRVDVGVFGARLRDDGTLFDITRLQGALDAITTELEGHNLNEVPGLAEPNPTAEVVARFLFERIAPAVSAEGVTRLEVRIWESAEAYAAYTGDLG